MNDIPYPSDDEMTFHFDKAKKFCNSFKEKHGEFPSKRINNCYTKQGDIKQPLYSMPLKYFEIENEYINKEHTSNNSISR